jgi:thiol-disulfide isomerase/thioredoxin
VQFALGFVGVCLTVASCATSAPVTLSARPQPPSEPAPPLAPLAQLEASVDLDGRVIGAPAGPTVVIWLASWCGHCRTELGVFDEVRATAPTVRWLAANYEAHEEYDNRGSSAAIRALADATPWLRVVPANEALFAAFGSPPLVPAIFVYDSLGALSATFDRRERPAPDAVELAALLGSIH